MKDYYQKVGDYYDHDAPKFEERYWQNYTLQITRQHFRTEVKKHPFKRILEIGYGPGLDMLHFASWREASEVYGIDVSKGMCEVARNNAKQKGIPNVHIKQAAVEQLPEVFPGIKFDLVYVFFGALNTVEDFKKNIEVIQSTLTPGGIVVMSSINRWFIQGMLIDLILGKGKKAFRRLNSTWGGYSPERELESKCYTPKEVKMAFKDFELLNQRSYSLIHPAWFHDHFRKKLGPISPWLWKIDSLLNRSPFWSIGEINLYTFKLI